MNATNKEVEMMTALEFANAHNDEGVIIRIAGNGCPDGIDIAWIPPDTELPFDLDKVEGEVDEHGTFVANNLDDGSANHPGASWSDACAAWQFKDWNGNLLYMIRLSVDQAKWQEEYDEFYGDYEDDDDESEGA